MSVVSFDVPRGTRASGRYAGVASRIVLLLSGACVVARPVAASPWLEPGEVGLRHDIELLVDEGLLNIPVTV